MQLPSIDRNPNLRPAGVDLASSGASRVIPVAPVNPSVSAHPSIEPAAGVVDLVNPALKGHASAKIYTGTQDPVKPGAEAARTEKDWTIHKPAPEKVEDPPPKPIYQVLLDHIKSMWTASANAVQMEQVSNQLNLHVPPPVAPADAPGNLAKEVLVYQPQTIKKTENV